MTASDHNAFLHAQAPVTHLLHILQFSPYMYMYLPRWGGLVCSKASLAEHHNRAAPQGIIYTGWVVGWVGGWGDVATLYVTRMCNLCAFPVATGCWLLLSIDCRASLACESLTNSVQIKTAVKKAWNAVYDVGRPGALIELTPLHWSYEADGFLNWRCSDEPA